MQSIEAHWEYTPRGSQLMNYAAHRYVVSILVDEDIALKEPRRTPVGMDLGLTDAVILSTGPKFGTPRFFRKDEQRLARAQRRLARKQKGSKNRAKARLKVARIHAKVADRRVDFLHNLSTRLINDNQVIAVASLPVTNMIRNHRLS